MRILGQIWWAVFQSAPIWHVKSGQMAKKFSSKIIKTLTERNVASATSLRNALRFWVAMSGVLIIGICDRDGTIWGSTSNCKTPAQPQHTTKQKETFSMKYFEIQFSDYTTNNEEWICIKWLREPTLEEAALLCSHDAERFQLPVAGVYPIDEVAAIGCYDFDNEANWPVFGAE